MNKKKFIEELSNNMREDDEVEDIWARRGGKKLNLGLINQFKLHDFIPNKWFDWERRVNAQIVIIGQDWGPYKELQKFIEDYERESRKKNFDYDKFLFKTFSSRTEKFILKTVEETYEDHYKRKFTKEIWDNFLFTMAVLFTRKGKHFRGNDNFDPKRSRKLSYPYLKRLLDIVQPKIIIPLGNLAFESVNEYLDLGYKEIKISNIIKGVSDKGIILKRNITVIPNYHPAAHVDPKEQKRIWGKLWEISTIQ